jgi:hypothetical protein
MPNEFLMTPDQHRRRAVLLRRQGSEEALSLALAHDQLAMAIEIRLNALPGSPPIAPA